MSRRKTPPAKRPRDNRTLALPIIIVILVVIPSLAVWLTQDHAAGTAAADVRSSGQALDLSLPTRTIAKLTDLPPGPAERVQVAYFHRTERCASCVEAERLTRKTLEAYFTEQVGSGRISLVVADVQKSANAALTRAYGASGSELYLGIVKNGTLYVYPVGEIWLVINNEARFMATLRTRIDAALGGG